MKEIIEIELFAKELIELINCEKFDEFKKLITPNSNLQINEIDHLINHFKLNMPILQEKIGAVVGVDITRREKIKEYFYRISFLQLHTELASSWIIGFYNRDKKWILCQFTFSEQYDFHYKKIEED